MAEAGENDFEHLELTGSSDVAVDHDEIDGSDGNDNDSDIEELEYLEDDPIHGQEENEEAGINESRRIILLPNDHDHDDSSITIEWPASCMSSCQPRYELLWQKKERFRQLYLQLYETLASKNSDIKTLRKEKRELEATVLQLRGRRGRIAVVSFEH